MAFNEVKLRHWMKSLLGHRMSWVEPGRGLSSGVPDAVVSLPNGSKIEIELKVWKYTRNGLRAEMRPAQIRYHYMTWHKKKGKTAILFAMEENDSNIHIYLLPGRYVPQDPYKHEVREKRSFVCVYDEHMNLAQFMRLLNKLLWEI